MLIRNDTCSDAKDIVRIYNKYDGSVALDFVWYKRDEWECVYSNGICGRAITRS